VATIEFADVTKTYPGAAKGAVEHVSFTVPSGDVCMLVGTSGSGKTTLLRMVNRLIEPTSGSILIDGQAITTRDPIELRRSIGYVIQQVGLFPHLTIEENVRVVPSIKGESAKDSQSRVDELLNLVGLPPAEFRSRYPRQLSGGQQQRVGLARALAADPTVMLMDEPFGALDAITRGRMQEELLRIQSGVKKTILFVTHDVDEAFKLGDQVVVLSEGRLIQMGKPMELLIAPANDFVRELVGADNVLRQFEYVPVTTALEPVTDTQGATIGAEAMLLTALLRLVQSGANELVVVRDGRPIGQVTLASIARVIRKESAPAGKTGAETTAAGRA
jgi:osmoprotectant transport system ATP-binding protein